MESMRLPAAALLLAASAAAGPEITTDELLEHVKWLAADERKGRESGGPEEVAVTEYIAERFAAVGLEPAGENGGWFQEVPFSVGHREEPGSLFELGGGKVASFAGGSEFCAFSVSGSGEVEGALAFAGYGITAPALGYDDFAEVDVTGRIVVLLRRTPRAGGAWSAPRTMLEHAAFVAKIRNATAHGAIAVVIVNDPAGSRKPGEDRLQTSGIGGEAEPIPCLHMTAGAAARLFAAAFQGTPEEFEGMILAGGTPKPASRLSEVRSRIRVKVTPIEKRGRNVCGLLRAGSKEAIDEVIIVGAHHDHVGMGAFGSLAGLPPGKAEIHNGADDNASGTSGLLEIAGYFASRRESLRRSILFLTFTGEERGLYGSAHYVERPTVRRERWAAMLNMDMIGRLHDRPLFVGGVATSPLFRPILERCAAEAGVKIVEGDGGVAPSDNTSFYRKDLPVLFFFSGDHDDYHRPTDDWDRIDLEGMRKGARLCAAVAEELARTPGPIGFRKSEKGGMGPPQPVLGITAGAHPAGVRIDGLLAGGPAERAGLKVADVVVALGEDPTPSLEALTRALRARQPGAVVRVRVLRGPESIEVEAKLAAR